MSFPTPPDPRPVGRRERLLLRLLRLLIRQEDLMNRPNLPIGLPRYRRSDSIRLMRLVAALIATGIVTMLLGDRAAGLGDSFHSQVVIAWSVRAAGALLVVAGIGVWHRWAHSHPA